MDASELSVSWTIWDPSWHHFHWVAWHHQRVRGCSIQHKDPKCRMPLKVFCSFVLKYELSLFFQEVNFFLTWEVEKKIPFHSIVPESEAGWSWGSKPCVSEGWGQCSYRSHHHCLPRLAYPRSRNEELDRGLKLSWAPSVTSAKLNICLASECLMFSCYCFMRNSLPWSRNYRFHIDIKRKKI